MSEYKQCPNGHYYQGDHCPYCKSEGAPASHTSSKTEIYGNYDSAMPTEPMSSGGTEAPTILDANANMPFGGGMAMGGSRTMFGDIDDVSQSSANGGEQVLHGYREARKLVGWLVSYTLDSLGVDFKIYEGRNIIGRDMDCNITVNDSMVSAKHAVLLYRAGKYSITDNQSSHGTFVNDKDIELEPCYLQDGDIIKMGQTTFKFRSSF